MTIQIAAEAYVNAVPADGFAGAFDDLYRQAYQTSYKLLGNRQDAEDIAQEACARACVRWQRLNDPVAWVVRVTTNLAFDAWRRSQRAAKHAPAAVGPVPAVDARRVDLHRALARLSKRQRDVVVLRYLADLSEAQTAAALGIEIGTIKSHAARGLRALRAELELDDAEDA